MRTVFVCILVLFVNYSIQAQQNLVPNPSFESTTFYPYNIIGGSNTINYAPPWKALMFADQTLSSIDLFCNHDSSYSAVPYNFAGFQEPSHGQSYMGFSPAAFFLDSISFGFESFFVELDSFLFPENNYELCLKYSPSDVNRCYNLSKISFAVTADSLNKSLLSELDSLSIFYLDNFNSCNNEVWTEVCSEFSPFSIAKFLTFCVIDNRNLLINDTIFCDQDDCLSSTEALSTYYYLDEVSLINKGKNTGFKSSISKMDFVVYPNPTAGNITFSFGKLVKGRIAVNNIMGQTLLTETVNGENGTLDLSSFSAGIYLLRFVDELGNVATEKIILE